MALDIIFISYDEPHADYHYAILKDAAPYARRVQRIKGIREAHLMASKTARTSSFFVVDADCEIVPAAEDVFSYKPPSYDIDYMHLWYCKNPVNGLVYGYGGIKLFHKSMFEKVSNSSYVDFSTTLGKGIKIMSNTNEYAGVTHFNSDPYLAYRGAFREAAKLAKSNDPESLHRLDIWCTKSDNESQFSNEVLRGANDGRKFALNNTDISIINDTNWLREQYGIPSGAL